MGYSTGVLLPRRPDDQTSAERIPTGMVGDKGLGRASSLGLTIPQWKRDTGRSGESIVGNTGSKLDIHRRRHIHPGAVHGNSSPMLRRSKTELPIAMFAEAREVPSGQPNGWIRRKSLRGYPDTAVRRRKLISTSRLGTPTSQWKRTARRSDEGRQKGITKKPRKGSPMETQTGPRKGSPMETQTW